MTVINPRGGATLAQVVQAALNIAGPQGVSIVTGGSGNGVQVPQQHVSAVEDALGWTAAEQSAAPTPPPTRVVEPEPPHPPPPTDPRPEVTPTPESTATPEPDPADEAPAPQAPAPAPVKKTTSSSRRARRGKEG